MTIETQEKIKLDKPEPVERYCNTNGKFTFIEGEDIVTDKRYSGYVTDLPFGWTIRARKGKITRFFKKGIDGRIKVY